MFKLTQLSINLFAIVKADEETSAMPIVAHGFIKVVDCLELEHTATLLNEQRSAELEESNELEALKETAIYLTAEAIADEFGD